MPITWKNVTGRESRTGVALLQGAEDSITAGLDGLKGLVDDRVEMKDANMLNERTNNTTAFAEELATYRDFDEYETALDSGAIDALRTKYGSNVDSAAMMEEQNNQLASLRGEVQEDRNDITSEQTFDTEQLKLKTDPIVEQINSFIQNDNPEAATAMIAEYKDILDRANLTSGLESEGEKRIFEVRDRNRIEDARTSTESITRITGEVINADTENDAVAQAIKLANEDKTISAADLLKLDSEVRKAWISQNKLSDADSGKINSYQAEENAFVTAELATLDRGLETALADNPVDKNSAFFEAAENNYSLGDAQNLADKNNYDKTAWIGKNSSVIEDTYDSVKAAFLAEKVTSVENKNARITQKNSELPKGAKKTALLEIPQELSTIDNKALNNIIYMAVGDMGDGAGKVGPFDTKQELDDGPFGGLKSRTTELLQEYLVSTENQINRDRAIEFHTQETMRSRNRSASNVTTFSNAIRKTAKDVRTGKRDLREAVENPRKKPTK